MSRRYKKQNNKKGNMWAIILLIICIVLLVKERMLVQTKQVSSTGYIGQVGIQRSNIAKLLTYTFYNTDSISQTPRNMEVEDSLSSFWYDKYIEPVLKLGYMETTDNKFLPNEYITYEQAAHLFKKIANNKYNIEVSKDSNYKDKNIPMSRFLEVYINILEKLSQDKSIESKYGIKIQDIIVLATAGSHEGIEPWKAVTDQGEYGFEGIVLDGYLDKKIQVLTKEREILGIIDIIDDEPAIESGYVTNIGKDNLTILIGGISKTYKSKVINKKFLDKLVDIQFENGQIISVDVKDSKYKDRILRVGEDYIETEKEGILKIGENLKIYDKSEDGVSWSRLSSIVVGTPDVEYSMDNKKINTITITKKPSIETIRILLNNTDFKDVIHKEVQIKSDVPFVVDFYGDIKSYKAGELFDIKHFSKKITKDKPRLIITPIEPGKLQLDSIKRRGISPKYSGVLEICKEDQGGYTLINEVSIEDYVIGVIPSEMPTSYGIEACKVQAITSRSYAAVHGTNNKFGIYGANLDDSTNSQVYNNIEADDTVYIAVKETEGKILKYKDIPISANCFSTSAGYTANYGEVWANPDGTFPSNTPVYLRSNKQYDGDINIDMKNEEDIVSFLKLNDNDLDCYDKHSPWFRWKVTMDKEELTSSINEALKQRYSLSPGLIKTLGEDRVFRSKEISDIGIVEKLQIQKRGEGGNIMEFIIYGSIETIKVSTEYNIRAFLSPSKKQENKKDIVLIRHDDSEIINFDMLPSAFFTMDCTYDTDKKLVSATFYGGGFGHGVGMSQDGVKGMVDKGYTHTKILSHYFPETTIGVLNTF